MPTRNRQVRLVARPEAIPEAHHFALAEAPLEPLPEGRFRVRNAFLSVDPAMRGWVSAVANYSRPVGIGEVMRAFAAGEIVESRHPDWPVGMKVTGMFGWQDFCDSDGTNVVRIVRETDLPLSWSLGVTGLTGLTGYLGLTEIGQPKPGETVVVSTAAGAVGSVVGQVAKILGCRTVGITGGPEKVALCRERFGYDAALDYKAETDLAAALAAHCPQGVDVYFDNTAGAISDAVHAQLANGARIVVCGTASISSWDPWPSGPRIERHILVRRARMQGFLFFDHAAQFERAAATLADWLRQGRLTHAEEILDGLDQAPGAIARLYRGENRGKLLVKP
ncbi:MAG TPA: NADP-dependent oxidoreductase [Acetobacteraceae bacterium]|nr:NADP-dependent oxidoreductase [Acetobacteraceae bacterium]